MAGGVAGRDRAEYLRPSNHNRSPATRRPAERLEPAHCLARADHRIPREQQRITILAGTPRQQLGSVTVCFALSLLHDGRPSQRGNQPLASPKQL